MIIILSKETLEQIHQLEEQGWGVIVINEGYVTPPRKNKQISREVEREYQLYREKYGLDKNIPLAMADVLADIPPKLNT